MRAPGFTIALMAIVVVSTELPRRLPSEQEVGTVRFAKREDSHENRDIIGTANTTPVPSVAETFGKHGDLHSERIEQQAG